MTVDVHLVATAPVPLASDPRVADQLLAAADLAPGAALVAALASIDVVRLDWRDRMVFLRLMHKAHNWLSGSMMVAVAAAAGPRPPAGSKPSPDPYSSTRDMHEDLVCAEVGAALNFTPGATAGLVQRARAAVGPLRAVNDRLLAGEWGETHLRRAVEATSNMEPAVVAKAAANVTARLRAPWRCTPATLGRRLQRELAALAPMALAAQTKARRRQRGAQLHTEGDFRGRLEIDAPWPELNWTYAQLDDWAKQRLSLLKELRRAYPRVQLCCTEAVNHAVAVLVDTEPGTSSAKSTSAKVTKQLGEGACGWCGASDDRLPSLSQLRADALLEAVRIWSAQQSGHMAGRSGGTCQLGAASIADANQADCDQPQRGRRWRHAIVVCDLATALGLANTPGWVPGYGHVPASLARELAAQASHWRRFLLDDNQRLVDTGRFTYRPSDALRELVTARDQNCTFPGCSRPAGEADLDHAVNFDGRNTTRDNLHPLCRTHHRMKTHGGWQVVTEPLGWHRWISPLGLQYTHRVVPPWLDP